MTVHELEDRMTDIEYVWWQQLYQREHDDEIEAS